jgi:hypothetical protein
VTPEPTLRERETAHILRQYQQAGAGFDGIHQVLLSFMREHRRAEPRAEDGGTLSGQVAGLGFIEFGLPVRYRPYFVIDDTVLLSYARLDRETVGAALVDAVHDGDCQVVVSPLSYLRIRDELATIDGGEQRVYRLLRNLNPAAEADDAAVVAPPVTFRHVDVISRLNTGERLDVMHTVLLALQHHCVIGTLEPGIYHHLGYPRTLNLAA